MFHSSNSHMWSHRSSLGIESFISFLYVSSNLEYFSNVGLLTKMYPISGLMIKSNYKASRKAFPIILHFTPANLDVSWEIVNSFLLYSLKLINLWFIGTKPGSPLWFSKLNLVWNLWTTVSRVWRFFSNYIIRFLFCKTFFISKMVFVLSAIWSSSNSSLVLEFKTFIRFLLYLVYLWTFLLPPLSQFLIFASILHVERWFELMAKFMLWLNWYPPICFLSFVLKFEPKCV